MQREFNVVWEDQSKNSGQVFSKGNHIGSVRGLGWNTKTKEYQTWFPVFSGCADDRLIQVESWKKPLMAGCSSLEFLCWVLLISTTRQENCSVVNQVREREQDIEV